MILRENELYCISKEICFSIGELRCVFVKSKRSRKTTFIIAVIIIGLLVCISVLPVSFDSWLYGNGFAISIADSYAYKLGVVFVEHHPEYFQAESYNYNNYTPSISDLSNSMEWHGSIISTRARIKFHDARYNVTFQGRRFWINKYIWKVDEILLE